MKVLIVIPAFNEGGNLPGLISDIRRCGNGYDMVVIDDSSSDNTSEVARQAGVPALRLAANLGIGGAVQTGFKYALRLGYDVVVQMDGDGQHDPRWLEDVLNPIRHGEADCVIGSRYLREGRDLEYKTPFARRLGMHFSSGILFLATRLHITDTTSGFRALNREALAYFARHYPVDHPEAEALLMLHRNDFRIVEVPIKMRIRAMGTSLFTFSKAALYPIRVIIGFAGLLLKRNKRQK